MAKKEKTPAAAPDAATVAAAAEAAKAKKAADAAAAKEKKDADTAAKAAAKAAEKAAADAKKAEADAKKAEKQAAADAKKAEAKAKADAKEAEKAAKLAAKEAAKQPEQNGVRRPGPNGLCGRVWGLADKLSNELGQPTPIANLLEAGKAEGLNEANIRTEYARWKKFFGLTGRITTPAPAAEAAPATA